MCLHRTFRPLWLLPVVLAGCSSTVGSRFGGTPQSRTIVVNGDRPLPASTGEPGGKVAAADEEPEPRRNPDTRISGRVVDEAGNPVPGATVRLADGGGKGGKEILGRTDRSGAFTLNGLRPGSSYVLIAEGEDDRGPILGRIEATTAQTGVKIALVSESAERKPTTRRAAKPAKAKPISNREDVGDEPEPEPEGEEAPRINREDVAGPGHDETDPHDPGPPEPGRVGRPRLAAPEPTVGWKTSRNASATRPINVDAEDETASTDKPVKRRRVVKPLPPSDPDDSENPLPPALDRDGSGDSGPARPASARSNASGTVGVRSPQKPRESGEIARAPGAESSIIEIPHGLVTLMPDPDPSLASPPRPAEVAETKPIEPPTLPPVGGDPVQLAAADPPGPTPSPPGPSPATQDVPPSIPAPQPVFASQAPTPKSVESPADYNPFANLPTAGPSTSQVVEKAPSLAKAPDESLPTPVADPPRKKWADVAATDSPAPALAAVAQPPKATLAGSLFRRLRPTAAIKEPSVASCSYDPKHLKLIDFRLPDLEGKPVRFQELDADFVLLDFWGTWCEPCLDAIPHLVALQKKYGPGKLKVVGIACEESATDQRKAKVDEVARRLGINYPVLLSTMDGKPCPVQQALQIQAMPTMILVDRKGEVLWRNSGSTPASESRLDRVLELSMSRTKSKF
jgi:thiol-disulfide isomerase/thioredoxin